MKFFDALGPFLGLILVIVFFSIQPQVREAFLSVPNLKIIAVQTVIVGVAALGMTAIITSGGIDLSVGSVVALSSVVGALLMKGGTPPVLAIPAMITTGFLVGLVNGLLITGLRLAPFIVTLGMLGIARGFAKYLAHEQTVLNTPTWLNTTMRPFPNPAWLIVAPGVWLGVVLVILMIVVLRKTVFGRHIFAIGSNESTARLCGVRVSFTKPCIYALGGFFFGVSGVLQLARLNQGDPTSAQGLELDVIAAVVIGGASLNGGVGSIIGSITGAVIMAILRNGSQQMALPNYVQEIIIGAIIIIAVALDRARHGNQS
ncbi:MAG: ABC transporter permease [Verrucomicrobia bacterium]|nr:ABC transporter permease [Verrucomicrobiota bacterium]